MVKNRDIIGCFGVILAGSGWLLSAKSKKIPKNGENWGLCGGRRRGGKREWMRVVGARRGRVEVGKGSETGRGLWVRAAGRRDGAMGRARREERRGRGARLVGMAAGENGGRGEVGGGILHSLEAGL